MISITRISSRKNTNDITTLNKIEDDQYCVPTSSDIGSLRNVLLIRKIWSNYKRSYIVLYLKREGEIVEKVLTMTNELRVIPAKVKLSFEVSFNVSEICPTCGKRFC